MNGKTRLALLLTVSFALFSIMPAVAADPKPPSAASAVSFTNSIGMEFMLIPAGSFKSSYIVKNERNEEQEKDVQCIISEPFYLGKYQVTQEQWVAVMGNNPAKFQGRRNPVEQVSWYDVQEFINRLNQKEGHARYRLPTEMEWELAARGGTDTKYFFMKDPQTWEEAEGPLADFAWYVKNSGGSTHPVGKKKPNPYGLYDIYGNVRELVQDWHAETLPASRELTDYRGPATGEDRVSRGGGWLCEAKYCRSGFRDYDPPDTRGGTIGFRLALSLK